MMLKMIQFDRIRLEFESNRVDLNPLPIAKDIIANGPRNPIEVIEKGNNDYVLVNGFRRYAAYQMLGWDTVTVAVVK